MAREPIFVVGVQRSGTTLLAAMLAAHRRLSCGPETHFFRFLARTEPSRLTDRVTWPSPAVEFLGSIGQAGLQPGTRKTLLDKYRLDEAGVRRYLQSQEPSIPAILQSVTEQYMIAKGKSRWVEKTPDHLLHLRSLREHFPRSPIIRIVRDPRDVALSLTKVPWGFTSVLEGLLYWERLNRTSRDFFVDDGGSYTLRFEDLVASPVAELRSVCAFIGEEFDPQMLDTSETGRDVNSQDAPWKHKAKESVDTGRVAVWRSELTRQENRLAEAIVGDQLSLWGYPREEAFNRSAEVHPGLKGAARFDPALRIVAAEGVRFWRQPGEKPAAKVYLGEPDEWLGRGKAERAIRAFPILADVVRAAVSNLGLYWVPEASTHADDAAWKGWLAFFLRKALLAYRVPCERAASEHRLQPDVG